MVIDESPMEEPPTNLPPPEVQRRRRARLVLWTLIVLTMGIILAFAGAWGIDAALGGTGWWPAAVPGLVAVVYMGPVLIGVLVLIEGRGRAARVASLGLYTLPFGAVLGGKVAAGLVGAWGGVALGAVLGFALGASIAWAGKAAGDGRK